MRSVHFTAVNHASSAARSLLALAIVITGIIAPIVHAGESAEPAEHWTDIVRDSPYWASQGVYKNISDVRRWVLKERGFCSVPDRHILFDRRGQFLAYISDATSRQATQKRLNEARASLVTQGKADRWVPGSTTDIGYPFALSCRQPHVDLTAAADRYLGTNPDDRLWGAWDDLIFASAANPGSLHDALMYVYRTRDDQQRLRLPANLPKYLGSQILIESSGQQNAHSRAGAKGILQLSQSALTDCRIKPANYWHRLAQVDCALRLMQQNSRNLKPAFEARFGDLPGPKRDQLFTLMLVQAYHGGAGRVLKLLNDDQLSPPAAYFADNHQAYSAGDILFGMIFHNLGRERYGLASLYYVADVQLATEALCARQSLREQAFCQ